jgi:hypothetical protein
MTNYRIVFAISRWRIVPCKATLLRRRKSRSTIVVTYVIADHHWRCHDARRLRRQDNVRQYAVFVDDLLNHVTGSGGPLFDTILTVAGPE